MTTPPGPMSNGTCLFCRICSGDIPAHFIHESPRIVAFLDIHPIRAGHVLIVPRAHVPTFETLPPELGHEIFDLAQRLAPILRTQWNAARAAFLFTGTDIAHAHAHVLPMVEPTDITSRRYIAEEQLTFRSTPRASDPDLAATATMLRAALAAAPS